jgi:hypothetical protein
MGPIEIVARRASQTVIFPADVAGRSETVLFPGRTYPPLAHRAASVPGTRLRGQGGDKSALENLAVSALKTKLLIVVKERNG